MVVLMVTVYNTFLVTIKRIISMPKIIKPLTDTQIKNTKPKDKDYKLSDGGGMFLLVKTNGSKWWRLNYSYNEKQQTISLGVYPDVTLLEAREQREFYKKQLKSGLNPSEIKKQDNSSLKEEDIITFAKVSDDWIELNQERLSKTYVESVTGYINNHINPYIGSKNIEEITSSDIISLCKIMEQKGILESVRRSLNVLNSIFKYAVAIGAAKHNVIADIDRKNTFKRVIHKHYPIITDSKELGKLLRAIDSYHGNIVTRYALKLASYVFLRPANIRFAEWSEINLESATWRIPAEKMKTNKPHIVPLAKQVIQLFQELKPITSDSKYVFPGPTTKTKPISENTMLQGLRRLDYTKDDIVAHSFRGIASTLLHENMPLHGIHSDAIERQLAHSEKNSVKSAYNHAEYLNERIYLMQWWADYLDDLKIR